MSDYAVLSRAFGLLLISLFLCALPTSLSAETQLSVTPQRCVTLREGQPCFIRIKFNWQSDEPQNVCAYGMDKNPITCWQNSDSELLIKEMSLPTSTEFSLRTGNGLIVAKATVTVSWVYRSRRTRRRWRLF